MNYWEQKGSTRQTLQSIINNQKLDLTIYLIHPVRKATDAVNDLAFRYVSWLEHEGHGVLVPGRDNPFQENDQTGHSICLWNRAATSVADQVHVIWMSESTGSHFDLGMAHAMKKPLCLVESTYVPNPGKSFQAMMHDWPWGLWIARDRGAPLAFSYETVRFPANWGMTEKSIG